MSSNSKATARAQKAAEMRAAQKRRETRRRILTIAGVVAVMALIIGGSVAVSLLNKKDVKAAAAGSSAYGVSIGDKDAPHSIVVYEDFLCPYCRELEAATRSKLESLAADGKVFVEYRPFDLLSQGTRSTYPIRAAGAFSIVLEKSGPEVAKKFHDLLYENQPSERDPDVVTDADLVELAVEAGADESAVKGPIEAGEGKKWVDAATQEAHASGVTGTPTVLLDGQVFQDGRTIDDMAKNLIAQVD